MANDRLIYPADPSPAGRQAATRSRVEDTFTKHWLRVLPEDNRIDSFRGSGATFAIPGNAALAQPLLSIENGASSTVIVAVRDLFVWGFAGAASATIFTPPWAYTFRTTVMPTGGTTFTKVSKDTRDSGSNANVIIRQAASADGTLSAVTAPLVAPRLTQASTSHWATMVGFAQPIKGDLLESMVENEHVLQPGQAMVVHGTAAAAADNATTRRWFLDFSWEEFSEF